MPVTVQIQTAGVPQSAGADQTVTFTSSSPRGAYSASSSGPWTPTLTVTIPAGSTSASVYYTDTQAGSPSISASLAGQPAVTQSETVQPAVLERLSVTPTAANVVFGRSLRLTATGTDAYGNAVVAAPTWSQSTTAYGRLAPSSGSSTTFTASNRAGTVVVTASSGGISVTSRLTIVKR
jgi:hypothetical protein